ALLRVGEVAAFRERPVAGGEERVRASRHAGRPVACHAQDGDAAGDRRRHGLDAAYLRLDRLRVGEPEVRRSHRPARTETLSRPQDEQVAAEARDLVLHRARGAVAERHHRDDRAHADEDAEDGEERAGQIAQDRPQGQLQRIPDHALTAALRVSDSTRPSTKRITRLAYAAMSGSCVTITMVSWRSAWRLRS